MVTTKEKILPFETEVNSFRTVNTKDSPASMKDDEVSILINFMPIGTTLNVVPGYSADLVTIGNSEIAWTAATAVVQQVTVVRPTVPNGFVYLCTTSGTTHATTEPTWPTTNLATVNDNGVIWTAYSSNILRFFDININSVLYKLVATIGGALYRVDASYNQVRLCLPGKFTNPKFEQWKYTNALIIDASGYYSYDGNSYPETPGGTAIAGTATKAKLANAIQYAIGNVLYSKAITDNFWTLTGFNCATAQYNACYLYIDNVGAMAIAAGTAASTLAGVVMPAIDTAKSLVARLDVHPTGTGTFTGGTTTLNDGTVVPTATFTDYTLLTKYTALSAPASGTSIAVFKTRVWIAQGRTITYSAPDSFADFTIANSGGTVIDNYPVLRVQINALLSTQDYLYVIGDHATHIIAGVQVYSTGSTVFNLLDAVPGIGSLYSNTVQVLGDGVLMMGDAGVHVVSGSNHELLSSYLDGIYPRIDTSFTPVACFAKIYNKLCYCVLVQANHPVDGSLQKFLLCYYEKKWFFVLYGLALTFIGQKATTTDTQTFAAYSNKLIQIFTGASNLEKRIRTKAYNFGTPVHDKQVLWLGASLSNNTGLTSPITATMSAIGSGNTDAATGLATVTMTPGTMSWVNGNGTVLVWTGMTWGSPYSDMLGMKECDGRGKRIQIDFNEISFAIYALNGIMVGGIYGADR